MIEMIRLHRVAMPLVTPFRTSYGVEHERDVVLVEVITSEACGWGECVALAEPSYSCEYADGALDVLRRFLVPRVLDNAAVAAKDLAAVMAPVKGHHMAKAAIEMALLDAELRARSISLAEFLGSTATHVESGLAVGIMGDLDALCDAVDAAVAQGYRRVKLKIEPEWDVEPVRAVRDRHPHLPLQVDANGSYTLADVGTLAALDPFELLLIEQPLAEDDLLGHAALSREITTPVCLDETITSANVAALALELGACSIVNLKPGRVGGLFEAVRIHDLCRARDVPLWCGGMFETGLGRAANLALASLPGFSLPSDLAASDHYYEPDLTKPFVLDRGRLAVPNTPGIGRVPDADVLSRRTNLTEEWSCSHGR
jgi:o-succinylbenzoate synthase